MTRVRPIRAIACLIEFIFLIAVQGCGHTPPLPIPKSLEQQLGKIGVVATTTNLGRSCCRLSGIIDIETL